MGLFSFFKKKPLAQNTRADVSNPLTIPDDEKIHLVYEDVFFELMAGVEGFTQDEISEMAGIIMGGQGGHLNMGRYSTPVFQKFFVGRAWRWREYDYWEEEFKRFGSYPSRWMPHLTRTPDSGLVVQRLYEDFKVSELKDFFNSENIAVPAKAKKADLLELVKGISDFKKTPLWKEKERAAEEKVGYRLYSLLLLYLLFRTNTIFNIKRHKKIGVVRHELMYTDAEDEQYVALALKRNPKALPPFFPNDTTMLQPVIPDFD